MPDFDPTTLLDGSDTATPQERLRSMAAALRNQRALGSLASLSGSEQASNFGKEQLADADKQSTEMTHGLQVQNSMAHQQAQQDYENQRLEQQQKQFDALAPLKEAAARIAAQNADTRTAQAGKKHLQWVPGTSKAFDPNGGSLTDTGMVRPVISTGQQNLANKTEELQVPGLEFRSGARPSPKDADTVKEALGGHNEFQTLLENLHGLYQKNGWMPPWGNDSGQAAATRTALTLALKRANGIRSLPQYDIDLLNKMVPDPSSAHGAFTPEYMEGLFSAAKNASDQHLEATIPTHNYQRAAQQQTQPQPTPQPPAQAARIPVRNKKTGATGSMSPASLAAHADTYEAVQP